MKLEAMDLKELKEMIRQTFVEVLSERTDLIEKAVLEAMEDIGLARAMEEGDKGEYIDMDEFKKRTASKMK